MAKAAFSLTSSSVSKSSNETFVLCVFYIVFLFHQIVYRPVVCAVCFLHCIFIIIISYCDCVCDCVLPDGVINNNNNNNDDDDDDGGRRRQ